PADNGADGSARQHDAQNAPIAFLAVHVDGHDIHAEQNGQHDAGGIARRHEERQQWHADDPDRTQKTSLAQADQQNRGDGNKNEDRVGHYALGGLLGVEDATRPSPIKGSGSSRSAEIAFHQPMAGRLGNPCRNTTQKNPRRSGDYNSYSSSLVDLSDLSLAKTES